MGQKFGSERYNDRTVDVRLNRAFVLIYFSFKPNLFGQNSRLNIGPKGIQGEKYAAVLTGIREAYCIPFYMATKKKKVARNLLTYSYNHLEKAIENARKLRFCRRAAYIPYGALMNGGGMP